MSCSLQTKGDFQKQGSDVAEKIVEELSKVHNTQELRQKSAVLKKYFAHLTKLILEARALEGERKEVAESEKMGQIGYIGQIVESELIDSTYSVSETLKNEMIRIYQMENGREEMEAIVHPFLLELTAETFKQKEMLKR